MDQPSQDLMRSDDRRRDKRKRAQRAGKLLGVGCRDPVVREDSQRLKKQLYRRGRASGPKWVSAVPQISRKAQPLAVYKAVSVRPPSKLSKTELIKLFPW